MGGACVAFGDATCANPALLVLNRPTIVLSYEQHLALAGLSNKSIDICYPTSKAGTFGASYSHFGDLAYSEQMATLAYGIQVCQGLSIGASLHYLHCGSNEPRFNSFNSATATIGLQYTSKKRWAVGLAVFNPFVVGINAAWGVPMICRIGVAYSPTAPLWLTAELEQQIYERLRFKAGAEYNIWNRLFVRAGFATTPMQWTIGVGYNQTHWGADVTVAVHQSLGVTPSVTLYYSL